MRFDAEIAEYRRANERLVCALPPSACRSTLRIGSAPAEISSSRTWRCGISSPSTQGAVVDRGSVATTADSGHCWHVLVRLARHARDGRAGHGGAVASFCSAAYWRWKSRRGPGRPHIPAELRQLIVRIATEHPAVGRRPHRRRAACPWLRGQRPHRESLPPASAAATPEPVVGARFSATTRPASGPPICSRSRTLAFRTLYVLIVIDHDRRRIRHWTSRSIRTRLDLAADDRGDPWDGKT